MDRRTQPGWDYKRRAVEKAGRQMREALDALNPKWLSIATLVPMPPSRIKSDPMYDDRLMQLIRVLGAGLQLDIREMIVQRDSTQAAHSVETRPRIDELCDNYMIEDSLVDPPPRVIGVIDDVLTTGSHFKAAQRLLRRRFPSVMIYGIFVARRVPHLGDTVDF